MQIHETGETGETHETGETLKPGRVSGSFREFQGVSTG
jgi:hypothetical protein